MNNYQKRTNIDYTFGKVLYYNAILLSIYGPNGISGKRELFRIVYK